MLSLALLATSVALQGGRDLAPDRSVAPARSVEGEHFRVICHFRRHAPASGQRALAAVEAVWPFAVALYGDPELPPGERLEVHLYRRAADYVAAEAALTGGRFRRNLAFAHFATRTAHVAVQPDLSDEALTATGPTHQTLRLLAHEAAHLVRYAAMPNHRSHPGWFADGNASWLETCALRAIGALDEVDSLPHYATYVVAAQRALANGRLPRLDDLLSDRVGDLSFYERYGARWLLFRFLRERHGEVTRRLVGEIRRLGGGPGMAMRVRAAALEVFETADFEGLGDEFEAFVMGLRPAWEQVRGSLETVGKRWEQAAFDRNAMAWSVGDAGQRYELSGALQVLPGRTSQLNVLLGRRADGFVSLAFVAGYGLTVFDYSATTDRWQRLAAVRLADLEVGVAAPFRIQVDVRGTGSRLRVAVAGRDVDLEVPHALDGPWGLGAQAGAAGVWSAIRCATEVAARPAAGRRGR